MDERPDERADERARLFVALELPDVVVRSLVHWREPIVHGETALRAVAAASLHVTLCFLGWQTVGEIAAITEACRSASEAHPEAALTVSDAGWLPSRRPRVLVVSLDDQGGRLTALQTDLAEALQSGGWYVPEKRPFLAHVTVARVGNDARVRRAAVPAPPAEPFSGSTVTLFRSRLTAAGAQYEALASVRLGRA